VYTGIQVVNDTCPFFVRLFPSQVLADDYQTKNPVLIAVGAIGIFVLTSLCFVAYDRLVTQRQLKVMSEAMHTSSIVSSLFPSAVRDRLFESNPNRISCDSGIVEKSGNRPSKPIADLYPSATVMFADMYVHLRSKCYTYYTASNSSFSFLDTRLVLDSQHGVPAAIRPWFFNCLSPYISTLTALQTT
jgi:hypothetical protein